MVQKESVVTSLRKMLTDTRYDFVQLGEYQLDRDDFVAVNSVENGDDELVTLEMRNYTLTFFASSIQSTCKSREPTKARFKSLMENDDVETLTVHFSRDSGLPPAVIVKKDVVLVERSEQNSMTAIVKTRSGERQIKFGFVNAIDATYKEKARKP